MLLVSGTLSAQAQTTQPTTGSTPPPPPPKMTKADGSPDMRYKQNKMMNSAPAGKMKKDGTPDMRYKANKGKSKM